MKYWNQQNRWSETIATWVMTFVLFSITLFINVILSTIIGALSGWVLSLIFLGDWSARGLNAVRIEIKSSELHVICKSVITKEKAKELDIALETKGRSFLQTLVAIPLFVAAIALPVASMVLGPTTNGVASAMTNVTMGAGYKIASEVTAGVGNKIIEGDINIQNQALPECIIEKTNKVSLVSQR